MRRRSAQCYEVVRSQTALLLALRDVDHARLTAMRELLSPFVTDDRLAGFQQVFADRLESVTAVLDAPHDPHNGAAILRTCDAFGVHRLAVLERYEPFLASFNVARGAQRWVHVDPFERADVLADSLEARGFELIGTRQDGELLPEDLAHVPRPALVFGNERNGIGPDLAARCRRNVRIPMRGFVESLNVSVSAAMLLRAATQGRPGDLPEVERERSLVRALILSLPKSAVILGALGFEVPRPWSPAAH